VSARDRWWVSVFALLVVLVARLPQGGVVAQVCELVWIAANIAGLVVITRKRREPETPACDRPPPRAVLLVQDQLEAFKTAGFTETQAKELMQEAMRTAIKTQGGWQA
jgi:hypothetical protein